MSIDNFVLSFSAESVDEGGISDIPNALCRVPFMIVPEEGAQDHLGSNLNSVTDYSG